MDKCTLRRRCGQSREEGGTAATQGSWYQRSHAARAVTQQQETGIEERASKNSFMMLSHDEVFASITEFFPRLMALVEELRQNEHLEIEEFEVQPPASNDDIESARQYLNRFGLELPSDLEEFYRIANGFRLMYRHKSQASNMSSCGRIWIERISEVFKDHRGNVYFTSFEGGETFRFVHPLDFFVEEACHALVLQKDSFPTIHYHYYGEVNIPFGLSLRVCGGGRRSGCRGEIA